MPSSTFNRLNPKKRSRFLQEAYKEFSLNTYQGASITNLVKTLGIAKGSVYQYFEDKDELYRFLVEESVDQLQDLLYKTCPFTNEEFFSWYNKLLIVQVRYLMSFPAQAILLRNMLSGALGIDRKLKHEFVGAMQSRIKVAIPDEIVPDEITNQLLYNAPFQLFDLLTSQLNLAKIISAGNPVYLDAKELMDVGATWTQKLKSGI